MEDRMWRVISREEKRVVVWATGHDTNKLHQVVQYLVNSHTSTEKYWIQDLSCNKEVGLDYFAEFYQIRKRTLEERLNSKI